MKNIDNSVYRKGYFSLGPLILLNSKFFNENGNIHRQKAFYYIPKLIISASIMIIVFLLSNIIEV